MGAFGGGFFGGGTKESKTTIVSTPIAQDQRVQLGGSAGTVVSPGAAMGGLGAAVAQPYGTVNQTITNSGLGSSDLRTLLDDLLGQQTAQLASVAGSTSQLADIIGATKAPTQTLLSSLLPWLIVGFILFLIFGRRR